MSEQFTGKNGVPECSDEDFGERYSLGAVQAVFVAELT
jgi:hypothetical protein